MGTLKDKEIRAWLAVGYVGDGGDGSGDGNGYGHGYGYGYGHGYGSGDGNGYGYGHGYGYGYGDGSGSGDGSGYGSGSGYGHGYGYGYGSGDGNGYGDGSGSGSGHGYGYGDGSGSGDGSGDGVEQIEDITLYRIDGVPTAILSIHGNAARGFVLKRNVIKTPCYVARDNGRFAHGATLREAFTALQEKLYDDSTEEERIAAFLRRFPGYDTPYPNRDLFAYHHVLTGSCRMGREQFCANKGISLDGKTTVRQFVNLTLGSYGSAIISQLPRAYGITKQQTTT